MHRATALKVHYYGTPVVLISSTNPDGTTNLAPMSSTWFLGQHAVLGLAAGSQTTQNLRRTQEGVLNLVPSTLVDAVDRLALTTGSRHLSAHKRETGYRYEPRKFETAGLTRQAADLVTPDRVAECPIQLEVEVSHDHPLDDDPDAARVLHVSILRAHVADEVRLPGTDHVDPQAWDPLIMKFCDFFGDAAPLTPSRLAEGWRMPGRLEALASA